MKLNENGMNLSSSYHFKSNQALSPFPEVTSCKL